MLCNELSPYVHDGYLDHPLVTERLTGKDSCTPIYVNRLYEYKKTMLEIAETEGDFKTWIFLHAPRYRVQAFYKVVERMPKHQLYNVMGELWTDPSMPAISACAFPEYFRRDAERLAFMRQDEIAEYRNLPPSTIAYRACVQENACGISWTRSLGKAKAIMLLVGGDRILTAEVPREFVFAYINRRGQDELVLFPDNMQLIEAQLVHKE